MYTPIWCHCTIIDLVCSGFEDRASVLFDKPQVGFIGGVVAEWGEVLQCRVSEEYLITLTLPVHTNHEFALIPALGRPAMYIG